MVLRRLKQKQISFGYCDVTTGQRVYPPLPLQTEIVAEQSASAVPQTQKSTEVQSNCSMKNSSSESTDSMGTTVTTLPPLAQATAIPRTRSSVQFRVLLETNAPDSKEPQVCVWHNHNGHHDWSELSLTPEPAANEGILLVRGGDDQSRSRRWYTAELSGQPKHAHVVSFTVKFKIDSSSDWQWVKDISGLPDGELHYQTRDFTKHSVYDLKHWFSGISSEIDVQSERPDTDDTHLYSLTCPINAATGDESGYQHHQLGIPTEYTKWFSLVRLWAPWLAPRQGRGKLQLDKDAVLLSFLRNDGSHVAVLGISGIDDLVTTFINDEHGNIIIKGRNDRTSQGISRVLVAVADSFEIANAAVMYHARKVVSTFDTVDVKEISTIVDGIKPEWMEEWYDGFTYCTWNGLGQDLTAQKIYDALDELAKEDINITNLIIDDNWQSLADGATQFVRGWSSFEANPKGFPDGMKATTTEIRKRHPKINHIAVWHAILGYWGGISPDGEIAKNYKTIEVEKEPGVAGGTFTVVAAEDAKRMYDDFYSFLNSVGIDSVKTDAQFFLDLLVHAPDRRALITEYQDAWTLAHLRHFNSRAISCMSQSPQMLFHSQLPRNQPRLLVRNSDDFFPDVEASHPWHVFCNAHNSLFAQHLNVLPDWDMFQTSHPWAGFHAAARCVSGGPIYFTDTPGQHDIALIRQMTAQTPRGKTVILRPTVVGKATDPYNAYGGQALLRVGTYVGGAHTGTGILGVFNVASQSLSELVSLASFPGTEEGKYVVGVFTSGKFSLPMSREQPSSALVGLELKQQGWDILSAFPLRAFSLGSSGHSAQPTEVAMLGLLGKMTGIAAVTGYDVYLEDPSGRLRLWTSLKALGVVGVYISDLPARNIERDFMVMIHGKPIAIHNVRRNTACDKVLEIDVATAWKETGEDPGWSNEVSFEIFVN